MAKIPVGQVAVKDQGCNPKSEVQPGKWYRLPTWFNSKLRLREELIKRRTRMLHYWGLCHKAKLGYKCWGRDGECE